MSSKISRLPSEVSHYSGIKSSCGSLLHYLYWWFIIMLQMYNFPLFYSADFAKAKEKYKPLNIRTVDSDNLTAKAESLITFILLSSPDHKENNNISFWILNVFISCFYRVSQTAAVLPDCGERFRWAAGRAALWADGLPLLPHLHQSAAGTRQDPSAVHSAGGPALLCRFWRRPAP